MGEYIRISDGSPVEAEQLERTRLNALEDATEQGEAGDYLVQTEDGPRIRTKGGFEAEYLSPEAYDAHLLAEQAAAAEAEAEAEAAKQPDSAGDADAAGEDPGDSTIPELTDQLASIEDPAELEALLEAERAGKDRVGAVEAIEARQAELEAAASAAADENPDS